MEVCSLPNKKRLVKKSLLYGNLRVGLALGSRSNWD
jgi:hypothetical protein